MGSSGSADNPQPGVGTLLRGRSVPGCIFRLAALMITPLLLSSSCSTSSASSNRTVAISPDPSWTTLFAGSSLSGWSVIVGANWELSEGEKAVVATAGDEGHIVASGPFEDFELMVEFWAEPGTNSGVYIRCANPAEITAAGCYEVNISDQRPDPTYRTGAIVNVSPPLTKVDAGGRWNEFLIRAEGDRLTVKLNGITTVDTEANTHRSGAIGLQFSSGTIKFRRVLIREI